LSVPVTCLEREETGVRERERERENQRRGFVIHTTYPCRCCCGSFAGARSFRELLSWRAGGASVEVEDLDLVALLSSPSLHPWPRRILIKVEVWRLDAVVAGGPSVVEKKEDRPS
jgi:hypothetical protein